MVFEEFRVLWIGLGVDHVDPREPKAGHDEITPLDMRMGGVGAKAGAASVSAEMVQLIAHIR